MPKRSTFSGKNLKQKARSTIPFPQVFTSLLLASCLLLPVPAYAAGLTRDECFSDSIPKLGCLPFYLGNVINGIFALSGIAAVILIILSGIRLLSSGGDPARVARAKRSLTFAVIGFVVVLMSFFILRIISYITGAECINALGYNSCS